LQAQGEQDVIDPEKFEKLAGKMRNTARLASVAKIASVHAEEERQRAKIKAAAAQAEFDKYVSECAKADEMPNLLHEGV
jgi:hypothetical protein